MNGMYDAGCERTGIDECRLVVGGELIPREHTAGDADGSETWYAQSETKLIIQRIQLVLFPTQTEECPFAYIIIVVLGCCSRPLRAIERRRQTRFTSPGCTPRRRQHHYIDFHTTRFGMSIHRSSTLSDIRIYASTLPSLELRKPPSHHACFDPLHS